jgi:hypothetical protein
MVKVRPAIAFCGAVQIAEYFHLIMQLTKRTAGIKHLSVRNST